MRVVVDTNIVSGDDDLLTLGSVDGVVIVTPGQFLRLLRGAS